VKLLLCHCGGKPVYQVDYYRRLCCSKCGHSTSWCSTLCGAAREWNRWQRMQPEQKQERNASGAFMRFLDEVAWRLGL
jgi:hypothetical protein